MKTRIALRIVRCSLVATCLLALRSPGAEGQGIQSIKSGNEMYTALENCDIEAGDTMHQAAQKEMECMFTAGFIYGVASALNLQGKLPHEGRLTSEQLNDIVHKYLKDHPELRNQSSAVLVERALLQAFPKGREQ